MNPLAVGLVVAALLAGPRLYGMVQSGQMDGTTAIVRGIFVAVVTALGAAYLFSLIDRYTRETIRRSRREALLRAIGETEAEQRRRAEEAAEKQSNTPT